MGINQNGMVACGAPSHKFISLIKKVVEEDKIRYEACVVLVKNNRSPNPHAEKYSDGIDLLASSKQLVSYSYSNVFFDVGFVDFCT